MGSDPPPIPSLSHGLAAVQVVQGDLIQQANRSLVTQLDTLASAILLENGAQLEGGGGTRVRCTDPHMTTGSLL